MGARLRVLRERAGLTQGEVAARMGLPNPNNRKWLSVLEAGRLKRPAVMTIVAYLRACGAVMGEFFSQFDALDYAPLDLKPAERARLSRRGLESVKQDTAKQVRKFQHAATHALVGKPIERAQAKQAAVNYGARQLQVNVVNQAVREFLGTRKVSYVAAHAYLAYARMVMGALRKASEKITTEDKPGISDCPHRARSTGRLQTTDCRLAEKARAEKRRFVEEQGLDVGICAEVERVVVRTVEGLEE